MVQRVVLYARISIAAEESVSVARQLESGRQYAAARGWEVVGEFVDEGVSATRLRPVERAGWRTLLRSADPFEAVVIWKVDRLARRVSDFVQTDEALQARGAAIVCVEQSLDMTTGEGRAFAQMLAVFGEMEIAALSSRLAAARAHMLAHGRAPGGLQPYGWHLVPNPAGPGVVRAQDPERIRWVRSMVERALRGDTVYSIVQWLNEVDAPAPRYRAPDKRWGYSIVDSLLRNPALAGMTPCNPGHSGGKRGPEVLRDADGQPVVSSDGIISLAEFDRLQERMARKPHPGAIRGELRRRSSPILSLLATCADCSVLLHRFGQNNGKLVLRCRRCGQCIAYHLLAAYLEQRLLTERGSRPLHRRAWVVPDDASASIKLASIDHQLSRVAAELTEDWADTATLARELVRLKNARIRARKAAKQAPQQVLVDTGLTLEQGWRACTSDEQRREILAGQLEHLVIARGNRGGPVLDKRRVTLTWRDNPESIAPDGISLDAAHAYITEPPPPWISHAEAMALAGCNSHTIRQAVLEGRIERRHAVRSLPSLSRASVEKFAAEQR